ncbi:hypothetical protein MRX96_000559 [Rhipicephalus microplus]
MPRPFNMEQPTVRDDGGGTRRRLQPIPAVPEEDDPPEFALLGYGSRWSCYCVAVIFVSVLTDLGIAKYLVPNWGWFVFEWALLLMFIGAILYTLLERLITAEPPPWAH